MLPTDGKIEILCLDIPEGTFNSLVLHGVLNKSKVYVWSAGVASLDAPGGFYHGSFELVEIFSCTKMRLVTTQIWCLTESL